MRVRTEFSETTWIKLSTGSSPSEAHAATSTNLANVRRTVSSGESPATRVPCARGPREGHHDLRADPVLGDDLEASRGPHCDGVFVLPRELASTTAVATHDRAHDLADEAVEGPDLCHRRQRLPPLHSNGEGEVVGREGVVLRERADELSSEVREEHFELVVLPLGVIGMKPQQHGREQRVVGPGVAAPEVPEPRLEHAPGVCPLDLGPGDERSEFEQEQRLKLDAVGRAVHLRGDEHAVEHLVDARLDLLSQGPQGTVFIPHRTRVRARHELHRYVTVRRS